ncbi:MAG: pentapeptide repeat-containing protein [Leptolyngbyaceae cyanobacterium]
MPFEWRRKSPSNDSIRQIAKEIYQNRLLLKRPGDAQSDWSKAEKITRSIFRKILFASHRPLIKLEKQIWEPLLAWANNQALLSLLGLLGNVGIIVAIFTYIGTEKQSRATEVLNAWQTITSDHEQTGGGGRIRALEFLNASPGANWRRRAICLWVCTWQPESLEGLDLVPSEEAAGVYLAGINLVGADLNIAQLTRANLKGADFKGVNLRSADLMGAELRNANLRGVDLVLAELSDANLRGAELIGAELSDAKLTSADLSGAILESAFLTGADFSSADLRNTNFSFAYLSSANFSFAYLSSANFSGADLSSANFSGADLGEANFSNSILRGANLEQANLEQADLSSADLSSADLRAVNLAGAHLKDALLAGANLAGANLTGVDFTGADLLKPSLENALLCGTRLPPDIDIDPDRDCAK